MKKLFATFILSLFATPCFSAPRWLTAVPRAVGRTTKIMAMPWTDKQAAIRDYLIVAAVFADGATSHRALVACSRCVENSALMPARPSAGMYWGEMGALAIFETSWQTWATETTRVGDPNKYWNAYAHAMPWITTGAFVGPHLKNTFGNITQKPLDRLH